MLILCYHAVSPTWQATLSVSPDALESQLRRLAARGWRGATFTEAVLRPPWPRTLAVTFDDAFLSVLNRAQPILAELGLPGTVFVPTGFVGERRYLEWPGIDHWSQTPDSSELECMRWDDVGQLSDAGWEIGSHTCTHPRLTRLDDAALSIELEGSRNDCLQHLGTCDSLAYPYGDVDERVTAAAERAGYLCAGGLSSSLARLGPHRWPRIGIYHDDASWRFQLKMSTLMRVARASKLWPTHE